MTTTTTRRAILAIGAALPALATSQALGVSSSWAAAPDPILAAIEAHRAAVDEAEARQDEHEPNYEKYVEERRVDGQDADVRERLARDEAMGEGIHHPVFCASYDAWDAATIVANEAANVLAHTAPTTIAGLVAGMTYLASHMNDYLGETPEDDTFLDDGLFSAVFASTIAEAANALVTP